MATTEAPSTAPSTPTTASAVDNGASAPVNDTAKIMLDTARDGIALAVRFTTRLTQDVIKPAIKTFRETCDTNPRIAAVVATPALLGLLLVLAFFTFSTLVLIIWTFITILGGVFFVIVGGITSLFFKLLLVTLVTLPLAGVVVGLLVGANSASQYIVNIIHQMPQGGLAPTIANHVQETDWNQVMEAVAYFGKMMATTIEKAGPISLAIWEGGKVIGIALYKAFLSSQTAFAVLGNAAVQATNHEVSVVPEGPQDNEDHHHESSVSSSVVFEMNESNAPEQLELRSGTSAEGLKRRTAYSPLGDNEIVEG
ncbi:hypothetical protein B0H34DRAFT_88100 [Crassisporium funariophilum]|nr:hypothetical protein B0H34DRAFT_88100 [Crassisporium funariophilum]